MAERSRSQKRIGGTSRRVVKNIIRNVTVPPACIFAASLDPCPYATNLDIVIFLIGFVMLNREMRPREIVQVSA